MLVWKILCYIRGRSDNLSWHTMTLLMKHGCVRGWWVLFTKIWINYNWNRMLRMCGLLKYCVSCLNIKSALAGETSRYFLLVFLNLLSATVLVPLLDHFLMHPGSYSRSHDFQKSDLRRLGIFFLAVSWIVSKGPLRLLYVVVSSVELPLGDSPVDFVVSICSVLLDSIACWGWQLCIDDTNGINFPN